MSALNGNILNKSTDKPNETCILHYDMDAFFASVEQHINPSLKGKPIAVGHGVLTTCSYEARAFGVKSAMPATTAKKLCPDLIILPVNIELYHKIVNLFQLMKVTLILLSIFISTLSKLLFQGLNGISLKILG